MELYLHVPFCVKKCLYCDFLSFPETEAGVDIRRQYVDKLAKEIRSCGKRYGKRTVTSIFIGGGTPSLLLPEQIRLLMRTVREHFLVEENAEITIEANPGAFDEERVCCWREEGINRLSLGLQSAHDRELRLLGRIHSYEEFLESFHLARKAGFDNINVDLMSALPEQTLASYQETLKKVLALSPEHISAYSLIIEEGTPFADWYQEEGFLRKPKQERDAICGMAACPEKRGVDLAEEAGKELSADLESVLLALPDEELDRRMYHETKALLARHGYQRYEISNYAHSGRECRHNIGYWNGTDYLGLGIGAASLLDGKRFAVTTSLEQYLSCDTEDFLHGRQYRNEETLTRKEQMEEFMFLGLRLTKGVSAKEFKCRFGCELESVYWEVLDKLEQEKLLCMSGKGENRRFLLTDYGLDVSNYALAEFLL